MQRRGSTGALDTRLRMRRRSTGALDPGLMAAAAASAESAMERHRRIHQRATAMQAPLQWLTTLAVLDAARKMRVLARRQRCAIRIQRCWKSSLFTRTIIAALAEQRRKRLGRACADKLACSIRVVLMLVRWKKKIAARRIVVQLTATQQSSRLQRAVCLLRWRVVSVQREWRSFAACSRARLLALEVLWMKSEELNYSRVARTLTNEETKRLVGGRQLEANEKELLRIRGKLVGLLGAHESKMASTKKPAEPSGVNFRRGTVPPPLRREYLRRVLRVHREAHAAQRDAAKIIGRDTGLARAFTVERLQQQLSQQHLVEEELPLEQESSMASQSGGNVMMLYSTLDRKRMERRCVRLLREQLLAMRLKGGNEERERGDNAL